MIFIDRNTPPDKDALTQPLRTVPGCTHDHIACRCETPYWIRLPTEIEARRWWEPRPRRAVPGDI